MTKGHVVTNSPCGERSADEIQVTLHDGTELKATVVLGHDEKTDLAVAQGGPR